jgi:hypothetical protein
MGDCYRDFSWDHSAHDGNLVKKIIQAASAILAITAGSIVLLGYFLPFDLPWLETIRGMILQWVIILTAVAILVGVANLIRVHADKIIARKPGYGFNVILLLSLVLTLILSGYYGPNAPATKWIYEYVQIPVEVSLMALVAVILVFSGGRLLNQRPGVPSIVFVLTAVLCLVGMAAWPDLPVDLHQFRAWILQVPAVAGARGLLLGIALGSIAVGIRVLIGLEKPYQG